LIDFDENSLVSVVGEVVASGRGFADDGCSHTSQGIRFGVDYSEPDTVWFKVSDATETTWLIEVSAPGMVPPQTGQAVIVDASTTLFRIQGNEGETKALLTRGSSASGLSVPVSSIMQADRACITFGACLNWAGYDLRLNLQDLRSFVVPLASSVKIDGVLVTNARFVEDVATTETPCDEPSAADMVLAFVWD